MRYLSLFSGIEACTVAWHPLGWTPVAFAEIDPFPAALLAHHYPDVPNLGDVSQITDVQVRALGQIDVVVGGSPCQDLSVAGKRAGLAGARSSLFHEQLRIFYAARNFCGARWLIWENVPGAFSSNKGRDFARVVAEMAGCRISVPRDGWGQEGMALGDNGLVEWSVLDAQWFGLAQRRKRVFVVLDSGDWSSRPPVLLEPDSVRGDTAPSREAWEGIAVDAEARIEDGSEVGDASNRAWPADVACTLNAAFGDKQGLEDQHALGGGRSLCPQPTPTGGYFDDVTSFRMTAFGEYVEDGTASSLKARDFKDATDLVAHTLRGEGFDASEDGTGRGTPLVPVAIAGNIIGRQEHNGGHQMGVDDSGAMFTLTKTDVHAVAFAEGAYAIQAGATRLDPASGPDGVGVQADLAYTLEARSEVQMVAFDCKASGQNGFGVGDVAPTLRAMGSATVHNNGGGQVAVAYEMSAWEGGRETDVSPTLDTRSKDGPMRNQIAPAVMQGMAVRRIIPIEAERLQGFEDDYTKVPTTMVTHRTKCELHGLKDVVPHGTERLDCGCKAKFRPADLCPDGPRYKAIGNSMATYVMRWIGARIASVSGAR